MTEKSSQLSAISFQFLTKQELAPCRIICDETSEDFRLTLCRTLCAGACPSAQEFIRENPRESVAVFLKAEADS
jgi:hypothetical protein